MPAAPQKQAESSCFPNVPELIFPNWREVLNQSEVRGNTAAGYSIAISGYLDYCRRNGVSVSQPSARAFMEDAVRRGLARNAELWKAGLNWFFREGKRCSGLQPPGVPSIGQADTGETEWERRLIERLRLGHYSWRTEQTYREWAWRLARFMGQRGLKEATGEEVKAFLTQLAVRGRVSAATQKQALNAIVFLFREALARDPGDLSGYELSRRGRRPPMVLSREECGKLFGIGPCDHKPSSRCRQG
jgi:hypothetical protein